jgi:Zn-dependent M28 family amino/carboxypeptidase
MKAWVHRYNLHFYELDILHSIVRKQITVPEIMYLVTGLPYWQHRFNPRSGHVGFVVDEVASAQVFSKYFRISFQFLSHQLLPIH